MQHNTITLHSLFKSETGNSIFMALWHINQKSITFTRTQRGRCWPNGQSHVFKYVYTYVCMDVCMYVYTCMCVHSPTD